MFKHKHQTKFLTSLVRMVQKMFFRMSVFIRCCRASSSILALYVLLTVVSVLASAEQDIDIPWIYYKYKYIIQHGYCERRYFRIDKFSRIWP